MAENMEMPPVEGEDPQKDNKKLIIIIAVVVVLCCCCVAIGTLGWQFGDQIMYELGLY
jgi:hypothetical protein